MGGLAPEEWMPTTFGAVAPDAAVLVYLSILDAPGMGGSDGEWPEPSTGCPRSLKQGLGQTPSVTT